MTDSSSNPLQRGSREWGMFLHQNHGTGGGNGSIMVVVFVCLCLASKKPSEREFFIPAGMDLAVNLLKLWASYFIVHWSCYWLVCTPFAAADDKGCRFGHHCCRRTSLNLIKHKGHYKYINFYFDLLNLFNLFIGGIGTNMRTATHISGNMGSSNPHRWRGEWLHHHGDGVW